jgi:hypothetical protein
MGMVWKIVELWFAATTFFSGQERGGVRQESPTDRQIYVTVYTIRSLTKILLLSDLESDRITGLAVSL